MVFYEVAPLKKFEIDYVGEGGKYQSSQELPEVELAWKPEMMLPRMHLDWEVREAKHPILTGKQSGKSVRTKK